MSIKYFIYIFIALSVFVALPQMQLWADGSTKLAQPHKQPTLDPRMPPVVPGEEVIRNGKKIKVWSTSGSPSVSTEVPAASTTHQNWTVDEGRANDNNGQGVAVIVDGRDLVPNRQGPKYNGSR